LKRNTAGDAPPSYVTYSAQFLTKDFISLIEGMERIEQQLREDLHLVLLEEMREHGAEIRGDVVAFGDTVYKLFVSMPPGSRDLDIVLGALPARGPMRTITAPIEGFGLVNAVTFELPISLVRLHDLLVGTTTKHYKRAYAALETAFVSRYGDWVATLFSTSYGIVNTELLVGGHPALRDRFWFSITDLDRMKFRYHFSRENLASTVAWLRANQDQFVSPCAAATLLITQDVADGVIGVPAPTKSTQYNDTTLIVEFTALPTLGVDTAYWVAERSLFESDALAAIHILTIDDRAFELNCPAEAVSAFAAVIDECREDLVQVVQAQYADFLRDQRKLHEAVERAKSSVSWMRSVGTDFAAKLTAELIKP
jgi:hypothetical protein